MRIERPGISWGAAHDEAKPRRIIHGEAMVEIYIAEDGQMVVILPPDSTIDMKDGKLRVRIPT